MLNINYSCIQGYSALGGEGNFDADPLFVTPVNPDDAPTTDGDLNLLPNSPCINTGTPDTTGLNLPPIDIAGNPRIYNGLVDRIDMGAYEFQGDPTVIYVCGDIIENTVWFDF